MKLHPTPVPAMDRGQTLCRLVAAGLALAWITGCGDGGGMPEAGGDAFGLTDSVEVDAASFGADRSVPIISVSRLEGHFVYRVHGELKSESEMLDLARNLAHYSPDLEVYVVPSQGLSTGEVATVTEKLRTEGKLKKLVIMAADGTAP